MSIEALTRRFTDAGSELGIALIRSLEETHPDLTAQVAHALACGERLTLTMEFDDTDPVIRLGTLNDYGSYRSIMEVKPQCARQH